MNRAVFLDRDGVINRKPPEGEYVACLSELELLPGVFEAVRELRAAGFVVVLITNQRGVARGKVSLAELNKIHQHVLEEFSKAGAGITEIYFCPHEGGCECRKPAPGMLLSAATEHDIDLRSSWAVGDDLTDIEAGQRAGCRTAWITDHTPLSGSVPAFNLCGRNLAEVVSQILEIEGCRAVRARK